MVSLLGVSGFVHAYLAASAPQSSWVSPTRRIRAKQPGARDTFLADMLDAFTAELHEWEESAAFMCDRYFARAGMLQGNHEEPVALPLLHGDLLEEPATLPLSTAVALLLHQADAFTARTLPVSATGSGAGIDGSFVRIATDVWL